MKTLIIIFTMILSANVYSQDLIKPEEVDKNTLSISELIQDDLYDNLDLIQEKSKLMNDEEKLQLYNEHEDSPIGPFLLNLLPGFGIGSFVQGNDIVGTIGLIGQGAGIIYILSSFRSTSSGFVPSFSIDADPGVIILIAGIPYLVNLIAPFIYSRKYNDKLNEVLNIKDKTSINFMPMISYLPNGQLLPSVMLSVNF